MPIIGASVLIQLYEYSWLKSHYLFCTTWRSFSVHTSISGPSSLCATHSNPSSGSTKLSLKWKPCNAPVGSYNALHRELAGTPEGTVVFCCLASSVLPERGWVCGLEKNLAFLHTSRKCPWFWLFCIHAASCQDMSCSKQGECIETIGNYTCSCFPGFYGPECEYGEAAILLVLLWPLVLCWRRSWRQSKKQIMLETLQEVKTSPGLL